jgi:F-type H+-transporting ATPase subunit alpha
MDPVTALILDKGRKNTKLLIQPQYKPVPVGQQIAILYCGTSGLMRSIPIDQVPEFERLYLEDLLLNHPDVVKALNQGVADEASLKVLEAMAARVSEKMTQKG